MGMHWNARGALGLALLVVTACSSDKKDGTMGGSSAAGGAGRDAFGNLIGGGPNDPKGGTGSAAGGTGVAGAPTRNPDGSCSGGQARTSTAVPRVILVLDGSCSMSTNYPANGPDATRCSNNPASRWSQLQGALLDPTTGVVTRLQDKVEFGVAVFGTQPMCPITATPINPALGNLAAISGAVGAQPPGQYTPTGAALDWVYDNMILGDTPDMVHGPQIVILATDGQPNSCDNPMTNYQPSLDALMKGKAKNVTTYVISLADAGTDFQTHLQQLADLGSPNGTGHLYQPSNREELAADLELLIGGAVGCDLALNGTVSQGKECDGSVVTLNGDKLECNGPDGWILADSRHIRVQGAACDRLKNNADAILTATFPCGVFSVD